MKVQLAYDLYILRSKQDLLYSFPQLIYQDVNGASGIDKKSGEDDEVCEEAVSQENIVRLFAVPDQTHHQIFLQIQEGGQTCQIPSSNSNNVRIIIMASRSTSLGWKSWWS